MNIVPLYNRNGLSKITGSFRFRGGVKLFMFTPGWYGWELSCRGYDKHVFPTWQDGVLFLEQTIQA